MCLLELTLSIAFGIHTALKSRHRRYSHLLHGRAWSLLKATDSNGRVHADKPHRFNCVLWHIRGAVFSNYRDDSFDSHQSFRIFIIGFALNVLWLSACALFALYFPFGLVYLVIPIIPVNFDWTVIILSCDGFLFRTFFLLRLWNKIIKSFATILWFDEICAHELKIWKTFVWLRYTGE